MHNVINPKYIHLNGGLSNKEVCYMLSLMLSDLVRDKKLEVLSIF